MSMFKAKKQTVRVMFNTDPELADDLKIIEETAKEKGLVFSIDEHLSVALRKLVTNAKKELKLESPKKKSS
jgi:hypothetical protein